jgi:hypothetical protein
MSTANFNNTTPAAPSGTTNVAFQTSGDNISANVPALPTLKTNGTTNSTQTVLNIVAGTNMTAVESGGTVTLSASGGGGGGGFGGGEAAFTVPVLTDYTDTNFSGATVAETTPNGIRLREVGTGNNNNLRSLLAVIPANSITTLVYQAMGIVIYDSISTNSIVFGLLAENGPIGFLRMSNPNGYNGTYNITGEITTDIWLRLSFDGTNLIFASSRDGQYFAGLDAIAYGGYISNPPDHWGVAINPNNAGNTAMAVVMEVFSLVCVNI